LFLGKAQKWPNAQRSFKKRTNVNTDKTFGSANEIAGPGGFEVSNQFLGLYKKLIGEKGEGFPLWGG